MKRVLLALLFVVGVAVGQTAREVGLYGCTVKLLSRASSNDDTIPGRLTVCIAYDPNMDKHFIVSTVTTVDGAGTSIVEEK